MATLTLLLTAISLVSASPRPTDTPPNPPILPGSSISLNALCGAYNGSATCTNSGFGNCCSQFGYCGSSTTHCGDGCQTNYGTCGIPTTYSWTDLGCYTDNTNARTLNTSILVSGNTVPKCQAACSGAGFTLAGVEYGSQCFCGTAILNGGVPITTGGTCNIPCAGDSAQICGGSDALNLYSLIPVWQSIGCYSDSTLKRTLAVSYNVAGNSVERCTAACQAGGYEYAGMEFGTQCFCGNSIDNGATLSAACATKCPGNAAQTCGGPNALSIYQLFGN
ncbi:WSC domain-containing protein [Aspergillus pseudodeflectus]|uniref:Uncharacterized protein n=2 Tax=Aspergillus subgen. Nidulantes TaxID=2720870 RepID=A0A0U5G9D0_ASPCI|nr:hypothetical protein ASPCAL11331 [Aspergillus calidoustus]